MTAIASPPNLQSLQQWENVDRFGDRLACKNDENLGRTTLQPRANSRPLASSFSSTDSLSNSNMSTYTNTQHVNGDIPITNGDQGGWASRKKAAKFWPTPTNDGPNGLSNGRAQTLPPISMGHASLTNGHNNPSLRSQNGLAQTNGVRQENQVSMRSEPMALLALQPITNTFDRKQIAVPIFPEVQKIGRQTNQKTIPATNNGYFDSKVLSRQHAEVWADSKGKIWIRDVKSSNGTFVNGMRLSQENKESDPHELHEGDSLELGIDIVSEDQKSIVHHKVSAKVELAGFYNNAPNFLDGMHIDLNTGQPLGDQMGQNTTHGLGKNGVHNNMMNQRLAAMGAPATGLQARQGGNRQMNMWMGPITVEQVVKKLNMELKQAKRQSQDLRRTEEYFNALLSRKEGEDLPQSPHNHAEENQSHLASNGPASGHTSFSHPPAPPPSQPLPEKPQELLSSASRHPYTLLQRSDTEKGFSFSGAGGRNEAEGGQIISLLEALKTAKQEIDSQGDRMKYLEAALQRERRARQQAEKRARTLYGEPCDDVSDSDHSVDEDETELGADISEDTLREGDGDKPYKAILTMSSSMETLRDAGVARFESSALSSETNLEDRYELLRQEFNEAKSLMDTYKRRADEAEEGQRRFADMIEKVRAGGKLEDVPLTTSHNNDDRDTPGGVGKAASKKAPGKAASSQKASHGSGTSSQANGSALGPRKSNIGANENKPIDVAAPAATSMGAKIQQHLERTLSAVISQHQEQQQQDAQLHAQRKPGELVALDSRNRLMQSAPYMSMVGVVLIGVGVMTWLNGWQSGDNLGSGGSGVGGAAALPTSEL